MADKLSRNIIFRGFYKALIRQFGESRAGEIWVDANANLLPRFLRQSYLQKLQTMV